MNFFGFIKSSLTPGLIVLHSHKDRKLDFFIKCCLLKFKDSLLSIYFFYKSAISQYEWSIFWYQESWSQILTTWFKDGPKYQGKQNKLKLVIIKTVLISRLDDFRKVLDTYKNLQLPFENLDLRFKSWYYCCFPYYVKQF